MNLYLETVIHDGDQSISFEHLESIESEIRKFVADERYAHAVQEVRIFTSRLAAMDGIVFFDVPGIDSGLGKHLEDSKEMLKDCDAVICIQRCKSPSLKAGEQKLIEFVKTGDEDLDLGDKLFVFLGRIDEEGTADSLTDNIKGAQAEWQKYGFNKLDRIIPGSSAAYLIQKNAAGPILKKNVGPNVIDNLLILTGSQKDEIEEATGIPIIQGKMKAYLQNDRTEVLKKRCDKLITKIIGPSSEIKRIVSEKYPVDIEAAKKSDEEKRIDILMEWWKQTKWHEIETELNQFYKQLCDGFVDNFGDEQLSSIKRFQKKYEESIKAKLHDIPSRC